MLWVVFNSNGQFIAEYNVGNLPYAGGNDFQIFAYFKELPDVYTGGSMKLYKPDLERDSYVPLIMSHTALKYEGATNDNLTNNQTYPGFLFDFANIGVPDLLDTSGPWRAVITLFSLANENLRNVVGSVVFEVGNGIEFSEGTQIDEDDVINQIYAALAAKLDINSSIFPQYIKAIYTEDISNFVFGESYSVNDIIVNKYDNKFYKLDEDNLPVLIDIGSGASIGYVDVELDNWDEFSFDEQEV